MIAGELAQQHVVFLYRLDVAAASDGDAVLGAFQLGQQVLEQAIGLQLRVVLGDYQQARKRRAQFALGLLEALHGLLVVQLVGVQLHAADLGPGLGDLGQDRRLMGGIALHRADQVGYQVGAPLVLVEHFRPGGFHLFVAGLHGVVAAAAEQQGEDGKEGISEESRHGGTHPG